MHLRKRWFALVALAAVAAALLLRKPLAHHFLTRGIAAREEWRLMDAERHFDRALLLDRSLDEARIEAGIAYELRGELTRSMAMLRSVDTNAIGKVAAARRSNALGTALFLSNDADAALREHDHALSLARAVHDRRLGIGKSISCASPRGVNWRAPRSFSHARQRFWSELRGKYRRFHSWRWVERGGRGCVGGLCVTESACSSRLRPVR